MEKDATDYMQKLYELIAKITGKRNEKLVIELSEEADLISEHLSDQYEEVNELRSEKKLLEEELKEVEEAKEEIENQLIETPVLPHGNLYEVQKNEIAQRLVHSLSLEELERTEKVWKDKKGNKYNEFVEF